MEPIQGSWLWKPGAAWGTYCTDGSASFNDKQSGEHFGWFEKYHSESFFLFFYDTVFHVMEVRYEVL
jgi:hypothetical protein